MVEILEKRKNIVDKKLSLEHTPSIYPCNTETRKRSELSCHGVSAEWHLFAKNIVFYVKCWFSKEKKTIENCRKLFGSRFWGILTLEYHRKSSAVVLSKQIISTLIHLNPVNIWLISVFETLECWTITRIV